MFLLLLELISAPHLPRIYISQILDQYSIRSSDIISCDICEHLFYFM